MPISKKNTALAYSVLNRISRLYSPYQSAAIAQFDLSVPLARLVKYGHVTTVSPTGVLAMEIADNLLSRLSGYQRTDLSFLEALKEAERLGNGYVGQWHPTLNAKSFTTDTTKWDLSSENERIELDLGTFRSAPLECNVCHTPLKTEGEFARHYIVPDARYKNLGHCPNNSKGSQS